MMNDDMLCEYVTCFRTAIDKARDAGMFEKDMVFYKFPKACCGDTCVILAEYLRTKGIETIYVCGAEGDQTHAWLVLKDDRVIPPTPYKTELPDDIRMALSRYGGEPLGSSITKSNYTEFDIEAGLIIDITSDQFGEPPLFIDYIGDFHKRFDFVEAHDYNGLGSVRLRKIYNIILNFME